MSFVNPYRYGGGVGSPDANTTFLCRFRTATPFDEVTSANGTLQGNAFCDTANMQLVLDGTGDYCEWNSSAFVRFGAGNWTLELHTNLAAAQVGGLVSRSATGTSRFALFADGTGDLAFYANNFSTTTPVVHFNCLNGSEHHIAIVRNGTFGGYIMFVDGVSKATNAWTSGIANADTDHFYVGDDIAALSSRDVAGRIGRVKISNISRWTSGFTPPSRTDV